jgi:hypothetical protein
MPTLGSIWDTLKGWFDRDRAHLIECRFDDPAAVEPAAPAVRAQADVHYFRLKLVEMFLGKQVAWFQNLYPAVQSVVRCNFGGQAVDIPNVADLTRLGIQASGGQGDLVARNFVLMPTLPFSGGTVAITAGLVALTGDNYLARFLKTLSGFAGLLAAPQVSAALAVAQPLAEGMQDLFGAGNGRLHLGYMNTLDGGTLQSGYFAIIRATNEQLDPLTLCVRNGQLCRKGAGGAAAQRLVGHDYLLFQLEVFAERDDWRALTAIDTPFREAVKQLIGGKPDEGQASLTAAVLAAFQARELTEAHRVVVIDQLKRNYAEYEERLKKRGLTPQPASFSLETVMAAAPDPAKTYKRPITLEEALAGLLPGKPRP